MPSESLRSFAPPERLLLGPGPSNLHPRVQQALARPCIGHLDPAFVGMMDELKSLLRKAFRTQNAMTLPLSAPGSAGMEACFVNLLEPGDRALVCVNGVFGARMRENVERCGGEAIVLETEWGRAVEAERLEAILQQDRDARPDRPIKLVAFVHAETSTGALSDARALARIARDYGALVVCDSVTGLGGVPLHTDEWELDAVYSGSQKCLSCPPGLSPLTLSERAMQVVRARKTKVQSWFLDLSLLDSYWGESQNKRSYHHTAPVNQLYALHEALLLLHAEGLENTWLRHAANHEDLRSGLETLGLSFWIPDERKEERLPQLNAVRVPEGADEARVRRILLEDYDIEIGAGLGPLAGRVWRIGLMGHGSRSQNVRRLLLALGDALARA